MDRSIKFKLLVPPRQNNGQINAVRPQETENSSDSLNTMHQGYSLCYDKEQAMPFVSTSVVAPSKPARQDFLKMTVVSPLEKEKNVHNPGELYSKLFEEWEKIKCWKVKVDTDTVQKERKLQDNMRTIETQRQAIQELQFGNENLSIKLEEQISENENLRNKNNATRNLCNILKETFQWSTEKMHLFESEREETHHLFMENSENIKKLIAEFDGLRIQVEAEKQEIQKVKEGLLEFEDLKDKYQQEHTMKDEEIAKLQTKLKDKKDELHKVLFDLGETQKNCKQLQDLTNQQLELLQSLKAEKESLLQKLHIAKQRCTETDKIKETMTAALEQSKRECEEMIQSKVLSIQELSREKIQLAEKLETTESTLQELSREKIQLAEKLETTETMVQELKTSLSLERQSTKDLKDKLMTDSDELDKRSKLLEEMKTQAVKQSDQIKTLEAELDTRSKTIESLKSQIDVFEVRVKQLVAELSMKTEETEMLKIKMQEQIGQFSAETKKNKECTSEMEQLQRDILQHKVDYEVLLTNFGKLQSEKTSCQQEFERETQKLEEENQCLRNELNNMETRIQEKCQETENVKKNEEKCEDLEEKITEKEKRIKAVEGKLYNLRKKFESKFQVQEEYKKENKLLKKQIAKETTKSSHLEKMLNKLQEESEKFKKMKDENCQKLLRDLDSKSTSTAELENEVQRLRITAAEAVKNKEDTELKCQHKIAEMVGLMEKHKSQYDRMVEEKVAELNQNQKKEMEAVTHSKSLEVNLSKQKTEKEQLRKQLKAETTEKETLQKEVADLKKEINASKIKQLVQARNTQSPASNYNLGGNTETPEKSSLKNYKFDFKMRKTPTSSSVESTVHFKKSMSATSLTATPFKTTQKTKHILSGDIKTLGGDTSKISGTSKIKSYRIKTPPSTEKAGRWGKRVIELDPKSDSSDHIELLACSETPASSLSVLLGQKNIFKKMQSPVTLLSPGNASKMAAVKRMRDAGWTAVTSCDKKKKKNNEKIFA